MNLPEPIPTTITDESFAGVTYHIRGALVPELQLELSGQAVMFEHHTLLWKETAVKVELRALKGGVKRKIAGLDFFVTKAIGPGRIAFSRDWPGQVIPLHLPSGKALNVREHHFLAATDNVDYSFERVKGVRNMLLGGSGLFIDSFSASNGDALLFVNGQGNVFEVELGAGETIDVEAGGWLYKDTSVTLESVSLGLKTGMFAGDHKMTFNRFTGPGKLAIQTLYLEPVESVERGAGDAAAGGVAGAVISGLLRG
ncbi:MAG TPA: AIM24 family protein [Solirubrobacteraceae bacterium]|nr:AIM24 family protein [Solirubrobacteraceae bacterium]